MDPHRFDTLVRTLTTGPSRRRLLGVLSALPLVGSTLSASDEDATAAKSKGKRHGKHQGTEWDPQRTGEEATSCAKQCRKKQSKQARRRCRKRCTPPTPECTTNQDCPAGELCESGVCIPIPDQCTGNADCDSCERCASGVCVAQCAPDEVCRGNQCETVQCTVDGDCGDCSLCSEGRCRWQCTVTEVCLSGAGGRCCQPRGCPAGTNCDTVDDGCGGQARCGQCTTPETCGGGGTPGVCGCTPLPVCPGNLDCGTIPDGCGGELSCGTCTVVGQVCGGSGTPNRCGCSASSCATGQVCQEGMCTCTPASCPDGCCDGVVCRGREDTACGRGGGVCETCASPTTCQQGVCSIYPTYGCTLQDNACTGSGNVLCPDNPGEDTPPFPAPNFCLIAASGYPLCSTFGLQSSCTSDAQCSNPVAPVCVVAQGECVTACRAIADPPAERGLPGTGV